MKGVEFLLGSENILRSPLKTYDDEVMNFIADLSGRLMKLQSIKAFPDIAALAFWCRRGNIERLKKLCPEYNNRVGRGLCFHVAPGNIPVNFAFSYLFGMLAGCANIVRVPSRSFMQIQIIIDAIKETLKSHRDCEERTAFVKYQADSEITGEFSKISDARMIWGGDRTIENIRSLKTKPRCIDICFADRYSICVINGDEILKASDDVIKRLSEDFYNDTYLMDQNACSSPQLVLWLNDSKEARQIFWDAVYSTAESKYNLEAAISVDKYVHLCRDSIDYAENITDITRRTNLLYRVELASLEDDMQKYRGSCGYFYEYAMKDINEICRIVTGKFQTLTYFGLDPENLRELITENRLEGIDRIVRIGRAMDISVIWDGFDLVRMLSRVVSLE